MLQNQAAPGVCQLHRQENVGIWKLTEVFSDPVLEQMLDLWLAALLSRFRGPESSLV